MATLYGTTSLVRKGLIGFLGVAIVALAFQILTNLPKTTSTSVNTNRCYLAADTALGQIKFPTINSLGGITIQGASYLLESVYSGFPDVAYVYTIEKPREKLLVFENAQKVISEFGFNSATFTELENNTYEWLSSDKTKSLKFNKIDQSWLISTKMEDNVDAIRRKTLSRDSEYYQNQVERIISTADWDNNGLDNPVLDVRFVKLTNGIYVEKTTPQESDYIIGNAYRTLRLANLKSKADLPDTSLCKAAKDVDAQSFTADPRVGQLRVIGSENLNNYSKDLYALSYTDFEYAAKKGLYSILTPDEAWNKIQTGDGSLVSLLPQNFNYFSDYPSNLSVRRFTADRSKTVLGYYEPSEWTGFVYPIYVFEGRAELTDGRIASFIFYTNALRR